jgi:hypothetical protein
MIKCFNKILKDHRPADQVFSADELFWITCLLENQKQYEDQWHVVYKNVVLTTENCLVI